MSRINSAYLSGPMSGIPYNNAEEFAKWHSVLRENGVSDVYDPTHDWMADPEDRTHAEYMRRTIHELTRPEGYDLVVMLPGWDDSEGARTERSVALACGIEVVHVGESDEQGV